MLWLSSPGIAIYVYPVRIVLMQSVSQFTIRLGLPATKWYSKAFASMGNVVSSTITLANWDPRYMNLLWNSVNVSSLVKIDTTLAATPLPIFSGSHGRP